MQTSRRAASDLRVVEFFIGYTNPHFNLFAYGDVTKLVALVRDGSGPSGFTGSSKIVAAPQRRDQLRGPDSALQGYERTRY